MVFAKLVIDQNLVRPFEKQFPCQSVEVCWCHSNCNRQYEWKDNRDVLALI